MPANLQGIWNDTHRAAVGQQVHHQHQHRDELLAGGSRRNLAETARAALRPDRSRRAGPARARRADALRRRAASSLHHNTDLWGDAGADRQAAIGHLADGRRVAEPAPVGSLRLHARPRVPARSRLPDDEGGGAVPARLPGRRPRRAIWSPGRRCRPRTATAARRRPRALHGADDGSPRSPATLFARTIAAARDARHRRGLPRAAGRRRARRLPPLQIGKHGQFQEWLEDYDEQDPGHRHISHLFALHPGHADHAARHAGAGRRRRAPRSSGGWRTAAATPAGAAPGSSTSGRACEDGDQAYEHLAALLADVDAAEHVRHPSAVPDRRQFRRHGRHRRDAAAEPCRRDRDPAGAAARRCRTAA